MAKSKYAVVRATEFHATIFAELHADCFDVGWSSRDFRQFLRLPACFGWLATIETENTPDPVGLILCQGAAGTADIITLGVLPAHRARGVASQLLGAAIDHAVEIGIEEFFLEVAADNQAAIAVYKKAAFREVGRRPNYYRGRSAARDASVFARKLT